MNEILNVNGKSQNAQFFLLFNKCFIAHVLYGEHFAQDLFAK